MPLGSTEVNRLSGSNHFDRVLVLNFIKSCLSCLIVWVREVLKRTLVGDSLMFQQSEGSHHQSQVNCLSIVSSLFSGQFSCEFIASLPLTVG